MDRSEKDRYIALIRLGEPVYYQYVPNGTSGVFVQGERVAYYPPGTAYNGLPILTHDTMDLYPFCSKEVAAPQSVLVCTLLEALES